MAPTFRLDGFRGEFLWELDLAERQMIAMAEAIPSAKYDWRPDEKAPTGREVIVHVATGNFMLLDIVGINAPGALLGSGPTQQRTGERSSEEDCRSGYLEAALAGNTQISY